MKNETQQNRVPLEKPLDYISRQAAIDALAQIFDRCEEIEAHLPEGDPDRTGYKMYPDYLTVWKYLHQLPSAQPEEIFEFGKWYDFERGYVLETTVHSFRILKNVEVSCNE